METINGVVTGVKKIDRERSYGVKTAKGIEAKKENVSTYVLRVKTFEGAKIDNLFCSPKVIIGDREVITETSEGVIRTTVKGERFEIGDAISAVVTENRKGALVFDRDNNPVLEVSGEQKRFKNDSFNALEITTLNERAFQRLAVLR